jgi:hypothetical protein
MEIVYFVLGMVTVLNIIGGVVIVKVWSKVSQFRDNIAAIESTISMVDSDLHRRIDGDLIELDKRFDSIQSHIDSRLDKFSNKLKEKELLKG